MVPWLTENVHVKIIALLSADLPCSFDGESVIENHGNSTVHLFYSR